MRVFPDVAGFWPRLGAAAVDWLLIAAAGQMIALPFVAFWSRMGPNGRFVGIGIVLIYFGVLNSSWGNGQTLGKRWLKIAVRGQDNRPISLARSLVRISILAAPFLLYGWRLPALQAPLIMWLTAVLVFGLGTAIALTMVLNLEARQGIHDLICGTYVVDTTSTLVDEFPRSESYHAFIAGGVLAVAALACGLWYAPSSQLNAAAKDIQGLQQALQTDPRYFTAQADLIGQYGSTLGVNVWYRGQLNAAQERRLQLHLARLALDEVERVYQFEYMTVTIRSGYDLGIAAHYDISDETHWISVWSRLAAAEPAP